MKKSRTKTLRRNIYYGLCLLAFICFSGCCKEEPYLEVLLQVSPYSGTIDTQFYFQAVCFQSKEQPIEDNRYRWDWESDGHWDTEFNNTPTVPHQFSQMGDYKVTVQVIDINGLSAEASSYPLLRVEGNEHTPQAIFTTSEKSGTIHTLFVFDASSSIDQETPMEELLVRWDWNGNGVWDTDFTKEKKASHQYLEKGGYTVILQVKDGDGLLSKEELIILVADGNFTDDRDGHNYAYITIGEQIWMMENLAFLPVPPSRSDSDLNINYYIYDCDCWDCSLEQAMAVENYLVYGVLYNWPAASLACPTGWHLPGDDEWIELKDYLIDNGYGTGAKGNEIANSVASTSGWAFYDYGDLNSPSQGGSNNASGFTALPGGRRGLEYFIEDQYDLGFWGLGYRAYFWSSTEIESKSAWCWHISTYSSQLFLSTAEKREGYSVRCIKN